MLKKKKTSSDFDEIVFEQWVNLGIIYIYS